MSDNSFLQTEKPGKRQARVRYSTFPGTRTHRQGCARGQIDVGSRQKKLRSN